jgi:hypothetical protein
LALATSVPGGKIVRLSEDGERIANLILRFTIAVSIAAAAWTYVVEADGRVKAQQDALMTKHFSAWALINAARGSPRDAGRVVALEDLNRNRVSLSGAPLAMADLVGLSLPASNLSRADLSGANLAKANLTGANLSGADLSGSDLSGANLSGANLTGANLSDAKLKGTIFCGTRMSNEFIRNTGC